MPLFEYKAVDGASRVVKGVVESSDELTLQSKLSDNGLFVIDIEPGQRSLSRSRIKVSRRELVDLFTGLSSMLQAGIDVSQSLDILQEETHRTDIKDVLTDLRLGVESGVPLDEAMALHPEVFEPDVCNLIKAGSHSGNLDTACSDVAAHIEWVDNLVAEVKQATIYPLAVLVAVFALILLLFSFVVPQFTRIFESMNMQLPGITRGVLAIGNFCASYWWLIIAIAIAFTFVVRILPRWYYPLAYFIDSVKLRLPLFGNLILLLSQSRFTHNLSLMMRAGVPIVEALTLLAGVVGNKVVSRAVNDARLFVTEGRRMSEGLSRHNEIFTPMVLRMIVIGEESGRLENCLASVSDRLDTEIPRRIKRLFSVLEPLIILVLIGIVGLVAAAIVLPLFDMMGGMM